MNNVSTRIRAALWWLAPLVALAAVIGWETDWGHAVNKLPVPAEAIAPSPVAGSLLPEYAIAGGIAARSETVQRTLFNPTRRPAPALAQDGTSGRLQRGQFALTGTTLVDGKNTAFLRELAGNRSRRVQAGEKVNGLLVAEVSADRVKLALGDESEELVLKVATNPRPTPAAVAAAAPATAPVPAGAAQTAAAPSAPGASPESAQSLAERRRAAARAAAAATASQGGAAPAAGVPATSPVTQPAAPAAAVDPRWGQMDQRYRERAASANRGAAQ